MRLQFETDRLVARPFQDSDAATVAANASDIDVAKMTSSMPHPYGLESAQAWILTHWGLRRRKRGYPFAIVRRADGAVLGSIDVFKRTPTADWEIGYMLGRAHWGQGYATEIARGAIEWARDELGATAIVAGYFEGNDASRRVLEKLGFVNHGPPQTVYSVTRCEDVRVASLRLDLAQAVAPRSGADGVEA